MRMVRVVLKKVEGCKNRQYRGNRTRGAYPVAYDMHVGSRIGLGTGLEKRYVLSFGQFEAQEQTITLRRIAALESFEFPMFCSKVRLLHNRECRRDGVTSAPRYREIPQSPPVPDLVQKQQGILHDSTRVRSHLFLPCGKIADAVDFSTAF